MYSFVCADRQMNRRPGQKQSLPILKGEDINIVGLFFFACFVV